MALIFNSVTNEITSTSGSVSFPGTVNAPASTTSIASLNIPHGTAPSSPTNGDVWTTTGGIYVRINGSTVGPLGAGGATTPAGADTNIQFNDGGAFGGDADFTWNKTTNALTFGATGTRIVADMSNATPSNRLAFQTSETNGLTNLSVIPNGTGLSSFFTSYAAAGATDCSYISIGSSDSAGEGQIIASEVGAGTAFPLAFYTGSPATRAGRVTTTGNWTFGSTTTAHAARVAVEGDLKIDGTARRIFGDFKSATSVYDRTCFQSTSGGSTYVTAVPSSGFTSAGFAAYDDAATAAGYVQLVSTPTINYLDSLTATAAATSSPLYFRTTSAGSTASRMILFGNGNINIGTSTADPGVKLNVEGAAYVTGVSSSSALGVFPSLLVDNSQASETNLSIRNINSSGTVGFRMEVANTATARLIDRLFAGGGSPYIEHEMGNSIIHRRWTSGGNVRMTLLANGNLNIGPTTTDLGQKLNVEGNILLSGTGRRILGDFSNATVSSRVLFQDSGTNQSTSLGVAPSGTGNNANFGCYEISDVANSPYIAFGMDGPGTRAFFQSSKLGTGTTRKFEMLMDGTRCYTVFTNGNMNIGSTTTDPSAKLRVEGLLLTDASDTSEAGLRIPHGAAPSSPVDGDIWTTTGGIYVRINGSTVGPFTAAGGSPGGSTTQVQYNNAGSLGGITNVTTDGTNLTAATIAGNLTFAGTARRLIADSTDATFANRLTHQSSVTNGGSYPQIAPNGTGTTAGLLIMNSSGLTNAGTVGISVESTRTTLDSWRIGSGTALPLQIRLGNTPSVAMTFQTNGNVNVGTTTTDQSVKFNVEGGIQQVGTAGFTVKTSGASTGFTLYDRSTTPGEQFIFQGNKTDGLYGSVVNISHKGGTLASRKGAAFALWTSDITVDATNAEQFQIANNQTYEGVIFTQKYGTGSARKISLHADWNGASTPTQLVLNTDQSISMAGPVTIKNNSSSLGFLVADRASEPGKQFIFQGNDTASSYGSVVNVSHKGGTLASKKSAAIAMFNNDCLVETGSYEQFQLSNNATYESVIFTQAVGSGVARKISLQTNWPQNTAPTQLVLNTDGTTSFGGRIDTVATATTSSGLRLPHGTAPTSPVNGDVWTTTGGMYVRINGSTVGPLGSAAPAGSTGELQYNNAGAFGATSTVSIDTGVRWLRLGDEAANWTVSPKTSVTGNTAGQQLTIKGGTAVGDGTGGSLYLDGGSTGAGNATGGSVYVSAKPGNGTGSGGAISLVAGAGGGSGSSGGAITITAGSGTLTGAGGNVQISTGTSPSGTAGSLIFYTGTTAQAQRMSINPAGNVVIAAPASGNALAVTGFASGSTPIADFLLSHNDKSQVRIYNSTNSSGAWAELCVQSAAGSLLFSNYQTGGCLLDLSVQPLIIRTQAAQPITLSTNNTSRLVVSGTGAVTINTPTSGNPLTVNGGKTVLAATVAGYGSLNLPHGTAPSAPADGDVWTTTGGMYVRINGGTVGPLGSAAPAGSDTYIQFNDGGAFGGDADLTWDKTQNIMTMNSGRIRLNTGGGMELSFQSNTAALYSHSTYPLNIGAVGASVYTGTAGTITIAGGIGTTAGGALSIYAGAGNTNGAGGATTIWSGNGAGTGAGGAFGIVAGNGGATNAAGGNVSITGGSGQGSGAGGSVTISTGVSPTGTAGSLIFKTGTTASTTKLTIAPSGISTFTNTVVVQDAGTSGYVELKSGDASFPGYVDFRTADNTRRGYIGYGSGSKLQLVAANSWTWNLDAATTIGDIDIGFRVIPRSTTTTTATVGDRGKCIAVTAGITIPNNTFAAGDAISIYNNSASNVTITQDTGLTMYLVGTATTGNRTLAQRGFVTIWFNSATDCVISGGGLT